MKRRRYVLALATLLLAAWMPTASAGVSVHFEAETLASLLAAASTQDIDIPVGDERTIRIELREIRLVQLEPAAEGSGGRGVLRTEIKLNIPEFDTKMTLKPIVVLGVVDVKGRSLFEMRFVELRVPVPIIGDFDIAPFVQPLRYPAEDLWYLPGARGTVHLRSRLTEITMGQRAIRFDFELEITDPEGS